MSQTKIEWAKKHIVRFWTIYVKRSGGKQKRSE